jgi:hypothetical protein
MILSILFFVNLIVVCRCHLIVVGAKAAVQGTSVPLLSVWDCVGVDCLSSSAYQNNVFADSFIRYHFLKMLRFAWWPLGLVSETSEAPGFGMVGDRTLEYLRLTESGFSDMRNSEVELVLLQLLFKKQPIHSSSLLSSAH